MSLTLADWSDYTKGVSSGWVTGISELYDQLSTQTGNLAQQYQTLADFNHEKLLQYRELANLRATQALVAGDAAKAAFFSSQAQAATTMANSYQTLGAREWLNSINAESAAKQMKIVPAAAFVYDATQLIAAVDAQDGQRFMEVAMGMVGAWAFAALFAGFAVALAFGPFGIIAMGVIGAVVGDSLGGIAGRNIYDLVKGEFDAAMRAILRRDPLTLDLDGDGLETLPVSAGVLFDQNGDGVATGTGWVGGDDGLLVWDRNGNGSIDSGRELFGDSTIKSNGLLAVDGFDALSDLDSNADGRVDALDVNFANLRVWRDVDADGITDAGELHTLTSLNITGFNTAKTRNDEVLPDGNRIADLGTFILANGSTATLGGVGQMADIDLAEDTFNRRFEDRIPLTEAAKALPEMAASGLVRDMREAASLSTDFANVLTGYAALGTRNEQLAALDGLLGAWASTSTLKGTVRTAFELETANYAYIVGDEMPFHSGWGIDVLGRTGYDLVQLYGMEHFQQYEAIQEPDMWNYSPLARQWLERLRVLEAFNGRSFVDVAPSANHGATGFRTPDEGDPHMGSYVAVEAFPLHILNFNAAQLALLGRSYEALRASVYESLVLQTRLKPYLEAIYVVDDGSGGMALDFTGLTDHYESIRQIDQNKALTDLTELIRFGSVGAYALAQSSWDGLAFLRAEFESRQADPAVQALMNELGVRFVSGSVSGTAAHEVLLGGAAADTVYGGDGKDQIVGAGGNDALRGDGGDDLLDGGAGDDYLRGGGGSDIYVFGHGDGHDTVENYDWWNGTPEPEAPTTRDVIHFQPGVLPSEVTVRRNGPSLVLTVGATGSVTSLVQFWGDNADTHYGVDQVTFSEGTLWTRATLAEMVLAGTTAGETLIGFNDLNDTIDGGAGNDTLHGRNGNDTLIGGDGTDTLYGDGGNDNLQGGAGDDHLDGGDGDDVLDGGAGNDVLRGLGGSDTFRFGRGDGADTIENYNSFHGWVDPGVETSIETVLFDADVLPSDVIARRVNDDLVLTIAGTSDSVRIGRQFSGSSINHFLGVDEVRFADGTVWTPAMLAQMVLVATSAADTLVGFTDVDDTIDGLEGNDNISGRGGDDTLIGGLGNDTLYGEGGNDLLQGGVGDDSLDGGDGDDVLEGGAGNDYLRGLGGSDTFRFGRGDGADTIENFNSFHGWMDPGVETTIETVLFDADVLPSEVVAQRINDDLVLTIAGTSDSVRVSRQFSGNSINHFYGVDEVRFADGTVWTPAMLAQMILVATSAADTLVGFTDVDDTIDGLAGNDNISGRSGNDTLIGGLGNDALYGEAGNDVLQGGDGDDGLDGGEGDDVLEGGAGNDLLRGLGGSDTFRFGRGDGADTIENYNSFHGWVDPGVETTIETVLFDADVLPSEVVARRANDDLVLTITGTGDSVRVNRQFSGSSINHFLGVDEVRFADGTVWTPTTLRTLVSQGTAAADTLLGFVDADTLDGLGGNDTLYGGGGNDVLQGGADSDSLYGEDGNDTLQGGAGADSLHGHAGDDALGGGADNDYLRGYAGNDVYLFGRGDGQDTVENYDAWNGVAEWDFATAVDAVQFGPDVLPADVVAQRLGTSLKLSIAGSNDAITINNYFHADGTSHGYGVDEIRFADGTVWTGAAVRSRVLAGTAAGETIIGFADGDLIDAGGGNDTVFGRNGDDTLMGADGADTLYGENGNDTLLGGLGNDSLSGDDGDDVLDGGAGNDFLRGMGGNDTFRFGRGDGADTIENYNSFHGWMDPGVETTIETVLFDADVLPSEVLAQRVNDDLVLTIAGTSDSIRVNRQFNGSSLNHFYGVDEVRFADGTVWTPATLRTLVSQGTAAGDTLIGFTDGDVMDGAGGNDNISGRSGNDTLMGGAGDDTLYGETGNDTLQGGTGNDSLHGDAGDDVMDGGTGNDWMRGYGGSDVYLFGRGDGQDTVQNYDSWNGWPEAEAATTTDTIEYKADVLPSEVLARRNGGNLVLTVTGTTDSITSVGQFSGDWAISDYGVDQVRFADGTVWTRAMLAQLVLAGTAAGETLVGFAGVADVIDGAGGNDNISGRSGNDTLIGGAGDDTLYGEDGNDTLQGGIGNDSLSGDAGNDVMEGGVGNDWMRGYGGSDVYLFGRGDGQDTVQNYDSWNGWPETEAATTTDTIEFKADVLASEVLARRNGGNLVLTTTGTTDSVTSVGQFAGDWAISDYGIDQVRFADGTVWTRAMIAQLVLAGTAAGETLVGFTSVADVIDGAGGNDNISGRSGNDTLIGGAGDDTLYGETGDDTLQGGTGNDSLSGDAGNDVMEGGAGSDWMRGYGGNDTYLFGRGDGQDTVENYDWWNGTPDWEASTTTDVVRFKEGVLASEVSAQRSGGDLVLSIAGSTDSIRVGRQFNGDSVAHEYGVDQVQFADGTVWTRETVRGLVLGATAGNDTIIGFADADTIDGGGGNDTIYGRTGNDLLIGGAGDDNLQGEAGNDTLRGDLGNDNLYGGKGSDNYFFDRLSGHDRILEQQQDAGDVDSLVFGDAIAPADLLVTRDGSGNLRIDLSGSSASVTFDAWFNPAIPSHVERFVFQDGTVLSAAQIEAMINIAPVANPDAVGVTEDATTANLVSLLLANDTDPDAGDTRSIVSVGTSATAGTVTFDATTQTLTYAADAASQDALAAGATATDQFGYTIADGRGATSAATVTVTLTGVNDAPTLANQIADQSAAEDGAFNFQVAADSFADVDAGDTLVLSATLAGGDPLPGWLTFDAATRTFSGTPLNGNVGTISVQVTATDGSSASVLDTFDIAVGNTNDAPVLVTPIADQSATENAPFTFQVSETAFSDLDAGDTLAYSATLANGDPLPAWLSFDGATRRFTGTPGSADIGSVAVKVVATDSQGAFASDVFDISTAQAGIFGTAGDDSLIGTPNDDAIFGLSGNDTLDGLAGADSLAGGAGNDVYVVDNLADVVTENASEGTDTVQSSLAYTLSANVENLTLTGTAAINGTGNTLDNILRGNSAANVLTGGAGNDTYFVSTGDTVTEAASAGTDTVNADVAWTLGANLEDLNLLGSANINGTGNTLANILRGNSGVNTLAGGTGNDTYFVSTGDTVTEASNAGTDAVHADVTWTLGTNIENLTLLGTANINATGNTLANILTGNAGNNTLSGGTGADTMIGGAGNDLYVRDNTGDVVTENANEGIDTVQSSVAYTLAANVENLELTGTGNIAGTGNALDNVLIGNGGTNSLTGGGGNDTYFIAAGDTVVEAAGGGEDLVNSSVTHTLATNVENLILTGTTAINATGNTLNNLLRGNAAVNTLAGAAGNDVLEGGGGNDILGDTGGNNLFNGQVGTDTLNGNTGNELLMGGADNDTLNTGAGADIIAFNRGDGTDTVAISTVKDNTVSLGGGITYAQLYFEKSGNNLVLKTAGAGATEGLSFTNWYAATANRSVLNLQVLVEASSDFDATSADPLRNKKVAQFNFDAMAAQFDAARAADPLVTTWALTNGLSAHHVAGSDSTALGGDLAYYYGLNGNLTGINTSAAQDVLGAAAFGTSAQTLRAFTGISGGPTTLS